MPADFPMERLLAREKAIVIAALAVVIAGSWVWLLAGTGTGMSTIEMTSWQMALGLADAMSMPVAWGLRYALVMLGMWWVMMIAMMLPSAVPVILLYARMAAGSKPAGGEAAGGRIQTLAFAAGYLLAWGLFSAVATGLQWAFESLGVLSPMMMNSTSRSFAGAILIFAGLYQLTPLKEACLRHCRSPLSFLMNRWRDGRRGALAMGAEHGLYCLGCCWGLMAILFFGGIMNLYWIVGLAVLVLIEKTLPVGPRTSRVSGTLLLLWGGVILLRTMIG